MDRIEAHIDVLRRALAGIDQRDPSALQSTMHPEIVWNELGSNNPLGGPFRGLGEVLSFIAAAFERAGGSIHIDVHDVIASEEHGAALVHLRGRGVSGGELDDRSVFVVHFRDGLISEVWSYAQDQSTVVGLVSALERDLVSLDLA